MVNISHHQKPLHFTPPAKRVVSWEAVLVWGFFIFGSACFWIALIFLVIIPMMEGWSN